VPVRTLEAVEAHVPGVRVDLDSPLNSRHR
jgi:hypothetical protein